MNGRPAIVERARILLLAGRHVTTASLADLLLVTRALVVVALLADGGFRRIDDVWELEVPRPRQQVRPVDARTRGQVDSPVIQWLKAAGRWCSYQQIADGVGWKYEAVVSFFYSLRANNRMGGIRQRTVGSGIHRHFELLWEAPTV